MSHDLDTAVCYRCGRTISVLDDEFLEWQAIDDEDLVVCDRCLARQQELELSEDWAALHEDIAIEEMERRLGGEP